MLSINNAKAMVLRILCLILCVAVVVSTFVACDNTNDGDDTSADSTETSSVSNSTETETTDPAQVALDAITDKDVDWGGKEFTILYSGYNGDNFQELQSEGQTGEILSNKVFERNEKFQDKCNLKLNYIKASDKDDAHFKAQREAQDGIGEIQYFTIDHGTTAGLAIEGLLYNFLDMGIDLETEWWDQGTYSFNLYGNVFFMNGSWNFSDDRSTWCMLFNKKAYNDVHPNVDPYQIVLDGEWTLDKFHELISNFSSDNGDGSWDDQDNYGFIATPHYSNALFFGSGLRYTNMVNGEDPTLALSDDKSMMDKASALVDKVLNIYGTDHSTHRAVDFQTSYSMFKNNQGLFYGETVSYVINLNAEYEGQFGVLPVPKYDVEQKDYLTYTGDYSSTLSIPSNTKDGLKIGAITQVFAIMSHQLTFPAFYDVVLTSKSVKDPQSVEMLNIIFQHRVYDISNYFVDFGLKGMFEKSAEGGNNNFSRDYAKIKSSFNRNVSKLFKKIK